MRTIRLETISGEGRGHLNNGGLQVSHRSSTIPRSMCLLPHLDPTLRTHCGAALRAAEVGSKVWMERNAHKSIFETERGIVYRRRIASQSQNFDDSSKHVPSTTFGSHATHTLWSRSTGCWSRVEGLNGKKCTRKHFWDWKRHCL